MIKRSVLIATVSSTLFSGALMAQSDPSPSFCETVKPTPQAMRETLHANYLPNFLPVIVNSEQALGLSAEQCAKFNQFRKEKAVQGKKVIKQINEMEAESHEQALKGASMDEIMQRHKEIAALREKITQGKMKCHQFVKSVLTDAQYQKLVTEIYPQKRAQALKMLGRSQ